MKNYRPSSLKTPDAEIISAHREHTPSLPRRDILGDSLYDVATSTLWGIGIWYLTANFATDPYVTVVEFLRTEKDRYFARRTNYPVTKTTEGRNTVLTVDLTSPRFSNFNAYAGVSPALAEAKEHHVSRENILTEFADKVTAA